MGASTSTWSWDGSAGDGRLHQRANDHFSETLSYDALGRVDTISTSLSVPGFTGSTAAYVVDVDYDGAGRLLQTTYPGGTTIAREYTGAGYPLRVKRGATVLQEYDAVDAFGRVTEESLSNGAMTTWRESDPLSGRVTEIDTENVSGAAWIARLRMKWRTDGALHERADLRSASTTSDDTYERFEYDSLDRLVAARTSASSGGSSVRTLAYDHDAHGNLLTKSSTLAGDPETTGYGYTNSSKPHRLTSATINGVATSFHYDANGNIVRYDAASGDDTFLDYDPLDQVTGITVGSSAGTSTPTARDEFWYGPDGARFLRRATWDDGGVQKTSHAVYLGGGVFEEIHPEHDPNVDFRQKVQATDAALVRREVRADTTVTTTVEYLHRDHLGSVIAVTDANGDPLHAPCVRVVGTSALLEAEPGLGAK